ncbi:uncharacterized protein LOC123203343 [Mangifera indica]|uniref:uncharacterized protein LOC123203343 n=1 Tax=Mangifera indica TaxID=29780 RepID=UPI001CFB1117|nr:uncharacterized protein LOC123203343 [Mangifera indica]
MERSEPTLVPQWLRSAGSATGGGSTAPHSASSSSHSDGTSSIHHTRSRNAKSISDFDSPRSTFLDRTSSSNSRRSSSNGSAKHAYSSFNRSHRDKERERDKDRLSYGDLWDHDSSDPLGNIVSSWIEKDTLRRSHSMVSRKQSEILPRSSNTSHNNGNGVLSGVSPGSNIKKSVFEKDFPSLGSEERGVPDIGRVSSPGLSSAVQSLPVGSSALIGGEGWTSALAEVPPIIGNNSSGSFSAQTGVASTLSGQPSAMAGLNMAEALAQPPARARAGPQLSIKTQRLEELEIKKSRQLIPVTPSMPKGLVHSFSDKSKPKTAVRAVEMNMVSKNVQPPPSSLLQASQSLHGATAKSDLSKLSHGKLYVLKPAWENDVSNPPKDVASPTSNANSRAASNQLAVAPSIASAPSKTPNNPKFSSGERKASTLNPIAVFPVERRPSLSQTQSRHDFFNHLKKKTSVNSSAPPGDSGSDISSPTAEKSGEVLKEAVGAPVSHRTDNGVEVTVNGDAHEEAQSFSNMGEKSVSCYPTVDPDEEAAFLRSLGWEENSGEDEGLTEEEINAFLQECKKRGGQLKLPEFHSTPVGEPSSELSSSDSGSEA